MFRPKGDKLRGPCKFRCTYWRLEIHGPKKLFPSIKVLQRIIGSHNYGSTCLLSNVKNTKLIYTFYCDVVHTVSSRQARGSRQVLPSSV